MLKKSLRPLLYFFLGEQNKVLKEFKRNINILKINFLKHDMSFVLWHSKEFLSALKKLV